MEFIKAWSTQGIVQELGVGVWPVFIRQPIPFWGQLPYAVIINPAKSVQETAGLALHKFRCELTIGMTVAVP
jgi:hypothetical protein